MRVPIQGQGLTAERPVRRDAQSGATILWPAFEGWRPDEPSAVARVLAALRAWARFPSASAARREVRALINDQCNWSAEPGDVRVRSLGPAPRKLEA